MNETKELSQEAQKLFSAICEECGLTCTPPEEYLVDDTPSENIKQELDNSDGDVLGLYYPDTSRNSSVKIFQEKCRKFAEWLQSKHPNDSSISAEAVEKIILVHELAHYVHHRGQWPDCPSGGSWEDFLTWTPDECENYAQRTTYLVLDQELASLVAFMSQYQPEQYRIPDSQSENAIGDYLVNIRRGDKGIIVETDGDE